MCVVGMQECALTADVALSGGREEKGGGAGGLPEGEQEAHEVSEQIQDHLQEPVGRTGPYQEERRGPPQLAGGIAQCH